MKVVIDLQGAQGEYHATKIGAQSLEFAKSLIQKSNGHEVIIALSCLCQKSISSILKDLGKLLPLEQIKIWHCDAENRFSLDKNHVNRPITESLREAFLSSLHPDVVIITHPFESYLSDCVTSIGTFDKKTKVALLIHDEESLDTLTSFANKVEKKFKEAKLTMLRSADLILTASEKLKDMTASVAHPINLNIFSIGSSGNEGASFDCQKAWDYIERTLSLPSIPKDPLNLLKKTSLFSPQKKRILAIKLDHMGDFVLALPALSKLRAKYPHADIDIMVGSWNKELAERTGFFHAVICYDFFHAISGKNTNNQHEAAQIQLPKLDPYDIAIDLRTFSETRVILDQVEAKLKIAYESFIESIDNNIHYKLKKEKNFPFYTTAANQRSISLQMIDIIDAIPADCNDYIFLPHLCSKETKPLKGHVAIFPKAGNAAREWGVENFTHLIERLSESDQVECINIYLPPYFDSSDVEKILSDKIKLHNNLSTGQLLDSLATNVLCICNNSFAAHISSYIGIKCLALYSGHETPEEWGPPFNHAYVLSHKTPCSPCHIGNKSECVFNYSCLSPLSIDVVYKQSMDLLCEDQSVLKPSKSNTQNLLIKHLCTSYAKHLSDEKIMSLAQNIEKNFAYI